MSKAPPKDPRALRITQQANGPAGRVYDLIANEMRIVLTMSRPDETVDGNWQVQLKTSRAPGTLVISGGGATRRAALDDAGKAWRACAAEEGLPSFDWEAMTEVLAAVRGLD